MMIRQLEKQVYPSEALLSLLLLADPDQEMITGYFSESILFVMELEETSDHQIVGVIVLKQIAQDTFEIMNLAISEDYQRQGIGQQLLEHVMVYGMNAGISCIKIATGNSSIGALRLYQKCGFMIDKVVKDYFINQYPEPIYEEGIQCRDRIELVYRIKSGCS